MTQRNNSKIAGFTFLFYIAAGITAMMLESRATVGDDVTTKMASIASHTNEFGVAIILNLLTCFAALILAVTLYSLTRDEDHDLAMIGMMCRVGEGIAGAASLPKTLALLWLATKDTGSIFIDNTAESTVSSFLLIPAGSSMVSATLFAVGSTIFSILMLRGRMIPRLLAWTGIVASVLLVIILPLQLGGFLSGPLTMYVWIPMILFEVPLAFWLMIKGTISKGP